jgi:beta-mannosidase
MLKFSLNGNWKFKLSDDADTEKIPAEVIKQIKKWDDACVPGTVHTDLLNNKLIDEPFYSDNELRLGWIAESDWVYEMNFNLPEDYTLSTQVRLVFDGIDTVAGIFLNGMKLANVDNMFRRYSFDVTDILKPQKNVLSVILHSPLRIGRELEKKYGKLPSALNSERVYLRKAQYSFGWDWGPSFPTMGIWKDVYLEQIAPAELTQLKFNTIEAGEQRAEVEIGVFLSGNIEAVSQINLTLENGDYRIVKEIYKPDKSEIIYKIVLQDPKLWYPNGEGEQALYNLSAEIISSDGTIIDSTNRNVGIRKIELKLEENGKPTFRFIVNGKPVFIKGVNWIPADSFIPRITPEKYSGLLKLAQKANINMVRVWGGGIYESDYFYELCDELGLLVWQDFMFACGFYPEHMEFIENVKAEVEENVARLQYHPSIAIWCGNNENEWNWHQNQKTSYKDMPGYKIYHKLIPSVIENLDPLRPYWQSSPFGETEDPNYQGSGNNHQWDIWSRWIDYDTVVNDRSLFVTEFGFQGPANISTLNKAIPPKNRKTYDRIFEHHNKQVEGTERIFRFMATHLPVRAGWEDFIYLGQLNQALALKSCVEHWRSSYPHTNGTIIWQINDCWPVTSWALVDSSLVPKIAYHIIKNTFSQSITVFVKNTEGAEVRFLNQQTKTFHGELILLQYHLQTGEELSARIFNLNTEQNSSKTVYQITLTNPNTIFVSYLYNEEGKTIHKNIFYSEPWKHAPLAPAQVNKRVRRKGNDYYLELSSRKPVLFLDLYHPKLTFSDRGFSLMPKEKILIKMNGKGVDKIKADEIRIFTLNDFLNG